MIVFIDPYLTIDGVVLHNNSAAINNPDGKDITCNPPPNCDNTSYSITWVDSNGNNVSNVTSNVIHNNGGVLKSGYWPDMPINFDATGVYTCQLYNTMQLKHELSIAIYKTSIG